MNQNLKKIIWIASYPKSGNTWLRAIISSMLYTLEGKFNFELLKLIPVFENLYRYDFVKKLNSNDHKRIKDDIKFLSKYWIESQKSLVFNTDINPIYNIFKTHSANLTANNNNFTNSKLTLGTIYIVRDPREVVVSYSRFKGQAIDETIDFLSSKGAVLLPEKDLTLTLMSSWDVHFQSWKMLNVPKLLIKYEDLLNDTINVIHSISSFLNELLDLKKDFNYKIIDNIYQSTHIEKFKKYEKNFGFNEASEYSSFFRSAKTSTWEKELSLIQITKIEKLFGKTMTELNYL